MSGFLSTRAQVEGGKVWETFDSHAKMLEKDLQKFQENVQELGSSLDLASSVQNLRDCVCVTSWLFRENASRLFPRTVKAVEVPQVDTRHTFEETYLPGVPFLATAHHIEMGPINVELDALADGIEKLRECLAEFPEFGDFGHWPLGYFQSNLKYWSSCLTHYEGKTPEVQAYLHDLSREIGDYFQESSRSIQALINRVPAVRLSQQHALSNLQNLATIATFFSAVTATTLQYSLTKNESRLARSVNALWFSSLVFSIASALNSSLVLMWRSARYSPKPRVPGWLWMWIRQCPSAFLILSVVAFLTGLGCFTISSQKRGTWITVLICEGISALSLATLSIWLAADKWSFSRLKRQRRNRHSFSDPTPTGKTAGSLVPIHIQHALLSPLEYLSRVAATRLSVSKLHSRFTLDPQPILRKDLATSRDYPSGRPISQQPSVTYSTKASSLPPTARQRWRRLVTKVIFALRAAQTAKESQRITLLQPYLTSISVSEEKIRHEAGASIVCPEFSPEGKLLAVSGGSLSIRHNLGSENRNRFRHSDGEARQVTWACSGGYLLTRTNRSVHIWSPNGNTSTINREETSSFILGVPSMKVASTNLPIFICIEGPNMNKLAVLDVRGQEHMKHEFDHISIQHADFIPGTQCLLFAATMFRSRSGLRPLKASPVRKLVVFNLETHAVEYETPLWHSVQYVTVSKRGDIAIVTYRNYPPPQIWRLTKTMTGIRLSFHRQLWPRDPKIRFSGKGHFLNKDGFLLCATTEGEIHFWRRDRDETVHVIGASQKDKDKTLEVACNPVDDGFMFATRSQDGAVRIWKPLDAIHRAGAMSPGRPGPHGVEEQVVHFFPRGQALAEPPTTQLAGVASELPKISDMLRDVTKHDVP